MIRNISLLVRQLSQRKNDDARLPLHRRARAVPVSPTWATVDGGMYVQRVYEPTPWKGKELRTFDTGTSTAVEGRYEGVPDENP